MKSVREKQDSGVGKLATRRIVDGDQSFQGGPTMTATAASQSLRFPGADASL
jgi:hypothetical protein